MYNYSAQIAVRLKVPFLFVHVRYEKIQYGISNIIRNQVYLL